MDVYNSRSIHCDTIFGLTFSHTIGEKLYLSYDIFMVLLVLKGFSISNEKSIMLLNLINRSDQQCNPVNCRDSHNPYNLKVLYEVTIAGV